MTRRLIGVLLVAAMIVAVFSISDTARADDPDYDTLERLIAKNRIGDRIKLDANAKLQLSTNPKAGVEYRLESLTIDSATRVATTTVEGIARFYLPVTDDHRAKMVIGSNDMAIYPGESYDVALDASEDGFSAYMFIHDASAPTSYEFGFTLPSGFKLNEDGAGGIEILNADDDVVGSVAAPWAVDSKGDPVQTAYKLRDNALVQTVSHIGSAYPVVADPTYTLGWNIYVWFNVPSEIDKVDTWHAVGTGIAGIAGCTTFVYLSGGTGGIPCGALYLYWGTAGALTLNDVIDELPSDSPDDCQLVGAYTYIGLMNYAEHSACGTDVKKYAAETNTAQEIFEALWPEDDD